LSTPVKSLLIDRGGAGETLIGESGGTLVRESLLPTHPDTGPITGSIADPTDPDGSLLPRVARSAANLSPRIARVEVDAVSPSAIALQTLDQLVVSSDRLGSTPAGALAVRQWLHAGGRLWVQLDRVSPESVATLLGHDFPVTVVDRVGLTRWRIDRERAVVDPDDEAYDAAEKPSQSQPGLRSEGSIDTFEAPVEMVRIVVLGIKPVHTVDGWPASFWMRSGRGVVLFTTLAPRGWVTTREKGARTAVGQDPNARFKESESLQEIGNAFLRLRDTSPVKGVALDPLLTSQVGYRVVSRGFVVGVLVVFCLGLVAGGWWLNRRRALAHLGWAGPVAALMAAGLLVAAGSLSRSQVPATISSVQFVEITPGDADAIVSGRLALYAPDGTPATLGAERGGVYIPDGSAGSIRRMVHTDLDRWHWDNLALAPGLHTTSFETTVRLSEPVAARVTFGPDGGMGTITPGPLQNLEDAILAMPSRSNFAVKLTGGRFTVGTSDRLPRGQYLASGVLTGDQQHRRAIYQQLIEQKTWPRYPSRPTLFAWANPLDLGFTFVEGARRAGSALVAIPLELERPAPGTRVTIPAPFLPFRSVSGSNLTVLHSPRQDDWTPRTAAARMMFRFQIPPELLPLRVERATLEFEWNAHGRTVEVLGGAGAEVLAARSDAAGLVRIELDRPGSLRPDATGGLRFGLAVGAGADEWKMTDLRLELTGLIPPE